MRRAVITGIGPVTPVGIGKEAFWNGIRSGRSAVRRVSAFDPSQFRSQIAAQICDFDPSNYLDPRQAGQLDRYAQFCVAAGRLAIGDAGLDLASEDPSDSEWRSDQRWAGSASPRPNTTSIATRDSARWTRRSQPCLLRLRKCNIAMDVAATGPVVANSNSCASGAIAIGEALGYIRRGEANTMLAGGAEAPIYPLCFGAFAQIRAMSCRNDGPSGPAGRLTPSATASLWAREQRSL